MSDSDEAEPAGEPEPSRRLIAIVLLGTLAVAVLGNLDSCTKRTHAEGEVTMVSGETAVAVGARCAVRSYPFGEGKCLTRVACGDTTLYGAGKTGYASCEIGDEGVLRVSDAVTTPGGGDPMLELDFAARSVELRDEIEGRTWSLTIVLDP